MSRYVESTEHSADNREAGDLIHVHPATLVGREPGIVVVNGKHLQFLTIAQALRLATKIANQIENVKAKAKTPPDRTPNTGKDRPPLILATHTTGNQ